MANNCSKTFTQVGSSPRGTGESNGNNNLNYGHYEEHQMVSMINLVLMIIVMKEYHQKWFQESIMTDNCSYKNGERSHSQLGSVNKSVAALKNMQNEVDNNYSGGNNNFQLQYNHPSRGFGNSEADSFHVPHSYSNSHSQSSNGNNTVPGSGSDAYDHGAHRFNPMSIPMSFLETLRKVNVFNCIPGNERSSFYEREIPFRNIDLVHLVIDACIQYFSEEIRKIFNQDNIDKRDIIRFNDINLQFLELSGDYKTKNNEKNNLNIIYNNYENDNNNINRSENSIDINSTPTESECWFGPHPDCHCLSQIILTLLLLSLVNVINFSFDQC